MLKPDSLQGSLDLLVLKILSRRQRLHGYAIRTGIQGMSGDVLRYDLTPLGKKQLAAEESRRQLVTAAVNRMLRMA